MTQAVELQKLVKKAFDEYDVDGSGALDYYELNLLINDMCFHLDLSELGMREMRKILDSVDESGDGEVQFEELLEHLETVIAQLTTFVANLNILGGEDTENEYNPVDKPKFIRGLGRRIKLFEKLNGRKSIMRRTKGQPGQEKTLFDQIFKKTKTRQPSPRNLCLSTIF
jgi:hypothetical protein